MTERLYYTDPFLSDFDATITAVRELNGHTALVLDRSAFYPTSGGQLFDTGVLDVNGTNLRIAEVAEDEHGEVLHLINAELNNTSALTGSRVHGYLDLDRRRDHMQQHSGQHVLSAAFVRLFDMPTVSFHMGDESCTIDLDTRSLTDDQVRQAEQLANQIVFEDREVSIRFASVDDARAQGVRKIPPDVKGELRLIDMRDFDLNACGGTHVARTGQIGPILLRKTEKVKQGMRVEFVCGHRAVRNARHDFESLTEAAAVYPTHIWTVPEQIRKSLDEIKAGQKERKRLLEELAELHAAKLLSEAAPGIQSAKASGIATAGAEASHILTRVFADRDAAFIKLVAQKAVASAGESSGKTGEGPGATVVLLGATGGPQPALVFAQTPGVPFDMGALMKDAMAALGGRGGGNRDMAQGGAPDSADISAVIRATAEKLMQG